MPGVQLSRGTQPGLASKKLKGMSGHSEIASREPGKALAVAPGDGGLSPHGVRESLMVRPWPHSVARGSLEDRRDVSPEGVAEGVVVYPIPKVVA